MPINWETERKMAEDVEENPELYEALADGGSTVAEEIERECVLCGETVTIELADDGRILSGGGYWPMELEGEREWWECDDCLEADGDRPADEFDHE